MSELKNCPYCGGEAELYRTKHIPNGFDYTPRCKKSGCCGRLTKKYGCKDTAVDFWNTRVPMQKIVERLEASLQGAKDSKDLSKYSAYQQAIDIVKEEGGLNEK